MPQQGSITPLATVSVSLCVWRSCVCRGLSLTNLRLNKRDLLYFQMFGKLLSILAANVGVGLIGIK